MTKRIHIPTEIIELVERGALFYCSHSGGKDSQAMYAELAREIPRSQLRVIHADLGDVEWPGVKDHIRTNIDGHDLIVAKARFKDGSPKDFFSAVRARREMLDRTDRKDAPAFPDSKNRYCTSDLKTGPIWREAKRNAKETPSRIIVNCVGIRGEESPNRAKKILSRGTLNVNKAHSNGTWECYDWWPIAEWKIGSVWEAIENKGQVPHYAYALGNDRLSCVFCIFGSRGDHLNGMKANPELFKKMSELEEDTRTTMFHGKTMADRLKISILPEQADLFAA